MKLQENPSWANFACGCGGSKESTPEELSENFKAAQADIDAKQAEIDQLKEDLAKAQAEMAKMKEEEETSVRADSIQAAAKDKGIELSKEAIDKAAASKDATEILISTFGSMKKVEQKVPQKFAAKVTVGEEGGNASGSEVDLNDAKAIRLAAQKLVDEKKAKSFSEAVKIITTKK